MIKFKLLKSRKTRRIEVLDSDIEHYQEQVRTLTGVSIEYLEQLEENKRIIKNLKEKVRKRDKKISEQQEDAQELSGNLWSDINCLRSEKKMLSERLEHCEQEKERVTRKLKKIEIKNSTYVRKQNDGVKFLAWKRCDEEPPMWVGDAVNLYFQKTYNCAKAEVNTGLDYIGVKEGVHVVAQYNLDGAQACYPKSFEDNFQKDEFEKIKYLKETEQ